MCPLPKKFLICCSDKLVLPVEGRLPCKAADFVLNYQATSSNKTRGGAIGCCRIKKIDGKKGSRYGGFEYENLSVKTREGPWI